MINEDDLESEDNIEYLDLSNSIWGVDFSPTEDVTVTNK